MIFHRTMLRALVFAPLMLYPVFGQACRMAPAGQLIGIDEQIRLASDVAVGQVISATPLDGQDVEYRFLSLDQLKGQSGKVFTVMGHAEKPGGDVTTFNDHADFAFWARGGGRVMNDTDCVIHPGFVVGSSYLMFLGSPVTRRSLEKIAMVNGTVNPDDRWLKYVKQQLAQRQLPVTNAGSATQDPVPRYERIGRFIYRFHRILARDDLNRKTLAGRQAPPELLLRAGRLADEFDHIVGSDNVPDAEIEATLAEATAVEKILAAWSKGVGGTTSPAG